MEITESNSNVIYSHFYTMVSYKKQLNENWSVYPSVLLKTARDYTQYDLNLNFKVKDNPLPWLEWVLNGADHTNFFENRVTEYEVAGLSGTWDDAYEAA